MTDRPLRILHMCVHDVVGGAAKAAYRLHTAFQSRGHWSRMMVASKASNDPTVLLVEEKRPPFFTRLRRRLPGLRSQSPRAIDTWFNFDEETDLDRDGFKQFSAEQVDVILLHWISELLTIRDVAMLQEHYQCPVVWTVHDQEPATGGCHYSFGCDGYTHECGECPLLVPSGPDDRSALVWQRKQEHLQPLPIVFACPTGWTLHKIQNSSLFADHEAVLMPHQIDDVFRPLAPAIAREALSLPERAKIVFFGAFRLDDKRKGMQHLLDALGHLPSMVENKERGLALDDILIVAAGPDGGAFLAQMPFRGVSLGDLKDDVSMALAYQAADVFICPSVEDAGPMMIPESMMCGTPVVAYHQGGAPDIVTTGENGYLAELGDTKDLARGIIAVLSSGKSSELRATARRAAEERHAPAVAVTRYLDLFSRLLGSGVGSAGREPTEAIRESTSRQQ